jgi:high-affinity iron transporter
VDNKSDQVGEINLDNAAGAVVAEIETIGPGTTASMTATLGGGSYTFTCYLSGQPVTSSAPVQVSSGGGAAAPAAVKLVTLAELTGPNRAYQAYAAQDLTVTAAAVAALQGDLGRGDLAAARKDWFAAQLGWERVGASYDSFGDAGVAVDGLPDGLPDGVTDPGFTGLHRLEYGLWHGQSAAQLRPAADTLARDIADVHKNLLPGTIGQQLATLQQALLAAHVNGRWIAPAAAPLTTREHVDAATGAVLESLSSVPDLLEVPPTP